MSIHILHGKNTCINLLENMLVRAKAGQIGGIMISCTLPDGGVSTAWSLECDDNVWESYAAANHLAQRFYKEKCISEVEK